MQARAGGWQRGLHPRDRWSHARGSVSAADREQEEAGPGRTRLTWTVEVEGFGVATIGRLFAAIYKRNLDAAIPALVAEMNAGELRSE